MEEIALDHSSVTLSLFFFGYASYILRVAFRWTHVPLGTLHYSAFAGCEGRDPCMFVIF